MTLVEFLDRAFLMSEGGLELGELCSSRLLEI